MPPSLVPTASPTCRRSGQALCRSPSSPGRMPHRRLRAPPGPERFSAPRPFCPPFSTSPRRALSVPRRHALTPGEPHVGNTRCSAATRGQPRRARRRRGAGRVARPIVPASTLVRRPAEDRRPHPATRRVATGWRHSPARTSSAGDAARVGRASRRRQRQPPPPATCPAGRARRNVGARPPQWVVTRSCLTRSSLVEQIEFRARDRARLCRHGGDVAIRERPGPILALAEAVPGCHPRQPGGHLPQRRMAPASTRARRASADPAATSRSTQPRRSCGARPGDREPSFSNDGCVSEEAAATPLHLPGALGGRSVLDRYAYVHRHRDGRPLSPTLAARLQENDAAYRRWL